MGLKIYIDGTFYEKEQAKISVFDHDMQAEILKHVVTISTPNGSTNCIVQSFHDSAGKAFVEVVEKLIPPVF